MRCRTLRGSLVLSCMTLVHAYSPALLHLKPSSTRGTCVDMSMQPSGEQGALSRTEFLRGLQKSAAMIAAAGAVSLPAARSDAATVPSYIDVAVDLGLGDDMILNVRQPYGLPKQSKADTEGGGDRQGTYVWPASTDLAKFLVSESGRKLVRGKRVVELGAGTGISGLAASIMGASQVAFTDGSLEVGRVTADTVARNKRQVSLAQDRNRGRGLAFEPEFLVERLRWGNMQDMTPFLSKSRDNVGYDVVLGAEITYLSASLDPLFDSIQTLLSSSQLETKHTRARLEAAQGIEELATSPLALLTFTSELTAFDGGGVKELERKAFEHGLRTAYLSPPPNNPDPDTNLMVLTLR